MIGYLHDLATHVTSDPRIALFCTEGLKRAQVPAAVSNIMMMNPETAEIVQPYVEPICFPGVDENCSARSGMRSSILSCCQCFVSIIESKFMEL